MGVAFYMNVVTEWTEQGRIPDRAIRFLIRTLLKARLKKEGSLNFSDRLNALYLPRPTPTRTRRACR